MFIVGGLRSILTGAALTGALTLPATSVQVPGGEVWFAPSVDITTGTVQPATPDPLRLSVPLYETVTGVLFHPLALGGGAAVKDATGGVESTLMPVSTMGAEIP